MVTPAARREVVAHIEQGYEMSQRRACSLTGVIGFRCGIGNGDRMTAIFASCFAGPTRRVGGSDIVALMF